MSFEKMYQELYDNECKKSLQMCNIIGYAKGIIASAAMGLLKEDQLMDKYDNIEKMWEQIYKKDNEKEN